MMSVTESRRERQHRELRQSIVDTALGQLERGGPSAVSLRGIARQLGISAPAIYTYFPSISELFTELISRSNQSLGVALRQALSELQAPSLADRLLAGPVAYRTWAIARPRRFNLIFFDQIDGYAAPEGGATVNAQTEMLRVLADPFADARGCSVDELLADDDVLDEFLGWWGSFHGIVALEVNHHLDWRDPKKIFLSRVQADIRELLQSPK